MNKLFRTAIFPIVILLAACGTSEIQPQSTPTSATIGINNASSTPEPASAILTMDSTSDQIQQAMINSATNWQTIWMDGVITEYAPDGSVAQVIREQLWLDVSTSRFRVLTGPKDGPAEKLIACDGNTILEMDLRSGQSQSRSFSSQDADPSMLWGQIGTRLSEIALSSNYAGGGDSSQKPVAMETIAGRQTLVVERTWIGNTLPSFRMWLDTGTAVVLKLQALGKGGGTTAQEERVVNQIVYNAVFDSALFGAPSSLPQWGDAAGTPITSLETGAVVSSANDALGELYFFTIPHQSGQSVQLVRLPGSCVVGQIPCPQPELIKVPFPFNFSLSELMWSPDGKFAAFAYPDNENGTPTKLFIFDPAAQTWTSIAEFPYIDPPLWSPDGAWLSFREQDGYGGENIYLIHPDGSGLRKLTDQGNLPADGGPYAVDGWLAENLIVRSITGSNGTVYSMRASDGSVTPMFDTPITKATFVPSPDNSLLAYDDYDDTGRKHTLYVMEPNGANRVELVSVVDSSIYPIVWSPDSQRLAYVSYANYADSNPTADVFVIGRDGRGVKQVYKGVTIGLLVFSPDGKYLLVNETTSPTGGHLFVVNLDTLEQRIVQAPNLSLDTDWYLPSWRP